MSIIGIVLFGILFAVMLYSVSYRYINHIEPNDGLGITVVFGFALAFSIVVLINSRKKR